MVLTKERLILALEIKVTNSKNLVRCPQFLATSPLVQKNHKRNYDFPMKKKRHKFNIEPTELFEGKQCSSTSPRCWC
jgi:hypothetical protein